GATKLFYNFTVNSTGIKTLGGALEVDGALTITAGTLATANNAITVTGNWTNSTGTFTAGNGTVTFDGAAATITTGGTGATKLFYNFTVNSTGIKTLGGALDVDGALTITAGTLDVSATNYAISVAGNWVRNGGTFTPQAGTVTFDGGAAQSIGGTADTTFNNLTLSTAQTRTIADGRTITINGTLTWTAVANNNLSVGSAAAATLTLAGAITIPGSCTLTAVSTSAINVAGNWTNSGTFTPNSSTVTFTGAAATITTGGTGAGKLFYNFTVNSAGIKTLGGALDVDGVLTITAGTLDVSATNYAINVAGNWSNSGTFTSGTGTVTFDGAAATIATGGAGAGKLFYNFTVDSTGIKTLGGALDVDAALTLTAGTLATANNNINVAGGWTNNATFTAGTGTVTFDGAAATITTGGTGAAKLFYNFTVNSTGIKTLGGALDVDAALTITAGTLATANNNINVAGNWSNSATFTAGTGTVTLDGAAATITTGGTGAGKLFYNFTVNSTGAKTLAGALDVDGTLTITAGTLDVSVTNYAISVAGNWVRDGGTFTPQAGTVTFDGGAPQTIGGTQNTAFWSLTLSTAQTRTIADGRTITVNGTLTWTAGSFSVGSAAAATLTLAGSITIPNTYTLTAVSTSAINVGGDWTNNGTFTPNSSTVTFTGGAAQTIGGTANPTFFNLTINKTGSTASTALTLTINGDYRNTNAGAFSATAATTFGSTGASAIAHTSTGNSTFSNSVTINKSAAVTVTYSQSAAGTMTVTSDFTNQGSGIFDMTSGTLTVQGNVTNTGTARWTASAGTPTVAMTGNAATTIANSSTGAAPQLSFCNLTVNKGAVVSVDSAGNFNVNRDLVLTGSGDFEPPTTATLTFGGTLAGAIQDTSTGSILSFNHFEVAKTAAVTVSTALDLTILGNYTCSGSGSFSATAGTMTFAGTAAAGISHSSTGTTTFNNLTVNKTAAVTVTASQSAGSAIAVSGNVSLLGSQTFQPTTGTISISGNLSNAGAAILSATGGTITMAGTLAASISNSSTGSMTFYALTIAKTAAVMVTANCTFTILQNFTNSNSGSFQVSLGTETPWQTNQNGTLTTDLAWDYTMGYRFTVNAAGQITELGGYFNGNKTVKLWDASTQILLEQVNINSANNWVWVPIPPVDVSPGQSFVVAVYAAGTGASYRSSIDTLPRTYGNVTIEASVRGIGNVYPTTPSTTIMYGQADVKIVGPPTVHFAGTAAGTMSHTSTGTTAFYNLNVNKSGGGSVSSTATCSVAGRFSTVGTGAFTATAGTVTLNGTNQTIEGSVAPTFFNLTVGGTSTLSLQSDLNVSGTLLVTGIFTVAGNRTIKIGTAAASGTVTINGTFNASGTTPTVMAFSSSFRQSFTVNGTLNVQRLNFQGGNTNGLRIAAGAIVTNLNNVAFTNALSGGRHMTIEAAYVGTCTGCSFDSSFTLGSGKNVYLNNASANVVMASWTGAGGGASYHQVVAGTLIWESSPPLAPSDLTCEAQATPVLNVTDSSPELRARHNDPDGDSTNAYYLQVSTDSSFTSVTHWDIGPIAITLANGELSPDIPYNGTFLTWGIMYSWRIRFRDVNNTIGSWSATQQFTMTVPSQTLPVNGWNMIGVPVGANATVAAIFGDDIPGVVVYEWNETARVWQQTNTIVPGRGYLVYSAQTFVDVDSGAARWGNLIMNNLGYTTLGSPTPFESSTNQFRGYHVISHPFLVAPNWTTIWAASVNLADTYYWWNGSSYVYYDASPQFDGGAGNAVPAWRGIWIQVTNAVNEVEIPNPVNPPEAGEPPIDANYWYLQIVATSGA
ncbi:MAG: hypothetical protein RDV41_09860, partial [Planctomycetota bacterium]|nr:hypothetical protein [Planctomycetota bacterium]